MPLLVLVKWWRVRLGRGRGSLLLILIETRRVKFQRVGPFIECQNGLTAFRGTIQFSSSLQLLSKLWFKFNRLSLSRRVFRSRREW